MVSTGMVDPASGRERAQEIFAQAIAARSAMALQAKASQSGQDPQPGAWAAEGVHPGPGLSTTRDLCHIPADLDAGPEIVRPLRRERNLEGPGSLDFRA